MPITGRKPKPDGQKRNRHQPAHGWLEVEDVPFVGPKLPTRQPGGRAWPPRTKQWWAAISSMPHCVLWAASDWEYALDTAQLAAHFHAGDIRLAGELRNREKQLGNTMDSRQGLRIRYVSPIPPEVADASGEVANMAEYRAALSSADA